MQHFAKRSQNIIAEFKVDLRGNPSVSNDFESISMSKLNFVFVIYLCGNGIGIMVFLGELIWIRLRKTRRKIKRIVGRVKRRRLTLRNK